MRQFGRILTFELKNYFKNKIFVGITVFLVLLIAGVMFFPRIADLFSQDGGAETPEEREVMLVGSVSAEQREVVKEAFSNAFTEYDVQITDEETDAVKEKIASGEAECAFVLTGPSSYTYYIENLSMYDRNTEIANGVLQHLYRTNAMIGGGMTPEQAEAIMAVQIESSVENLGVDQMENYWYTYIMIFALYMVILLYGQMVATNVATEKSSRAMEVLITSAKPSHMMFGKVLASCLAGLLQLICVFGSAILFYGINREHWGDNPIINSIFDMPPDLFGYLLVFFVLGFLIYAFLFGAVGSTASKVEDINTSVMPITLLFVAGFIVVMTAFASGDVDSLLMRVCSYIPFTSSMAMFTRIAMSTVQWYEILLSAAILVVSAFGIGIFSAKIYRVGVLLYGTTPKIGTVLKAVWKA